MTSFSWKKKTGSSVKRDVSVAFEEDTKNENDQLEGVDWLTLVPHKKIVCLEDAVCKSSRLKDEGSLLAQSERFDWLIVALSFSEQYFSCSQVHKQKPW